ncbi:PucR family transcriptional regulator [Gordonia rubripertincta]|uniref:Helix-turn-helix domain-containing protein n=1 Tax=Gordonia rubripertincta TaxID=36822 RepID=A0ABT4MNZ4_GORRU|nr:helix-turn-helix domain-containing protein [Gordonia rubripertincta]MCZ4548559.1 helix-turn-helix domain-containing protein [Gordonia rubripertincta]
MEDEQSREMARAGVVATRLLADITPFADEMLDYLSERIPEAVADDEIRGLTLGSCSSNIESVLSMVRHGINVSAAEAPVTALEHARAMAARGYDVDVMLRFYRLGYEFFLGKLGEAIPAWIDDPSVALSTFIALQRYGIRYIDQISSAVAVEYLAELRRRQNRARAERGEVVRALLAGEAVGRAAAERILGHRLTGMQVGFICWSRDRDVDLDKVARRVALLLGSPHPLLLVDGPEALQGWVSISGKAAIDPGTIITPSSVGTIAHVAIGSPHPGPAGFRRSHDEARRARRVAQMSERATASITRFADVALVDVITRDLDAARSFIADELGDLASDEPRTADERAALLAVLDAQGSLAGAASYLGVHRNTVLQRVRRAEHSRGRPASERVAELHAALRVCETIGPTVLTPPQT